MHMYRLVQKKCCLREFPSMHVDCIRGLLEIEGRMGPWEGATIAEELATQRNFRHLLNPNDVHLIA